MILLSREMLPNNIEKNTDQFLQSFWSLSANNKSILDLPVIMSLY